ncbi:eukaryotic translation initiation factor 2 subunit 2-like [Acanthaster planci]|uniref:Eukaryotic translation initiation factor 2 subunit 2 n=1 Tax=Acanthaster planci TaxID=133434 RepID=A0A8B7XV68_ACAPL|nr:eukaryotic translation initiation factor 2 subunit 2-like [Acanthaster planci]
MADDEAIFDPTMKKKKKKKKMPFDLEAALEGGGDTQESTEAPEKEEAPKNTEANEADKKTEDMDFDLDFSLKKKKKKKKTFDMDAMDDALAEVGNAVDGESQEATKESAPAETNDFDADLDFDLTKKKKKKKKPKLDDLGADTLDDSNKENEEKTELKDTSGTAWAGTERDYLYDELLTRVFDIIRAKNPDMVTGEKKRFIMRPPQVVRVGTKKTSFVNFTDICKMLHRPTEHLLAFLLAEMGASGSIDGNNQLIIKGRFQQKQVENILRRYIKEYVTCHTCRSSDTFLHKENRLFFLQCERCQSRCSVTSIKSGYQAVTAKRAQIRAKAN